MKKSMMLLLAVMGIGCAALRADTIATNANCKVAVVAYMNGCLQISMTGSTALQLTSCDVSIKLYDGDRHEILNETDHQRVYDDVRNWIEERL